MERALLLINKDKVHEMALRRTSIHEAAHAVVARAQGVQVSRLELTRSTLGAEGLWVDGCVYYGYPVGFRSQELEHAFQFVSLAGFVAECFDEDREHATVEAILELIDFSLDSMSDSDRRGAGKITYAKMWRTLYLVRKHWAEIERVAAEARDAFEAMQMQKLAA